MGASAPSGPVIRTVIREFRQIRHECPLEAVLEQVEQVAHGFHRSDSGNQYRQGSSLARFTILARVVDAHIAELCCHSVRSSRKRALYMKRALTGAIAQRLVARKAADKETLSS